MPLSLLILAAAIQLAAAGDVSAPLSMWTDDLFYERDPPVALSFEGHRMGTEPSITFSYEAGASAQTMAEAAVEARHALGDGVRYRVLVDAWGTHLVPTGEPAPAVLDGMVALDPGRRSVVEILREILAAVKPVGGGAIELVFPLPAFDRIEVEAPAGRVSARDALGQVLAQVEEQYPRPRRAHTHWRMTYDARRGAFVLTVGRRVLLDEGASVY